MLNWYTRNYGPCWREDICKYNNVVTWCFAVVKCQPINLYPLRLPHCYCNHTITSLPVKQPWNIWAIWSHGATSDDTWRKKDKWQQICVYIFYGIYSSFVLAGFMSERFMFKRSKSAFFVIFVWKCSPTPIPAFKFKIQWTRSTILLPT